MRFVDLASLTPAETVAAVEAMIDAAQGEDLASFEARMINSGTKRAIIDEALAQYRERLLTLKFEALATVCGLMERDPDTTLQ